MRNAEAGGGVFQRPYQLACAFAVEREVAVAGRNDAPGRIIGHGAMLNQFFVQRSQGVHIVVDALENRPLLEKHDSGIGKSVEHAAHLVTQLSRMNKRGDHDEGFKPAEHPDQLIGKNFRSEYGRTGSNADDFNMGNAANFIQCVFQAIGVSVHRITAREDHVTDRFVFSQILDGLVEPPSVKS